MSNLILYTVTKKAAMESSSGGAEQSIHNSLVRGILYIFFWLLSLSACQSMWNIEMKSLKLIVNLAMPTNVVTIAGLLISHSKPGVCTCSDYCVPASAMPVVFYY